jgi:hypothetical protein
MRMRMDHRLLRWNIKRHHAAFLLVQEEYSHARGGYVTVSVMTYIHVTGFGTHLTFADVAVLRRGLPQRRNATRVVVNYS